ncbi:MAG: hypothetical protein ACI8RD_009270, partial [Bacillariaceae sp.]
IHKEKNDALDDTKLTLFLNWQYLIAAVMRNLEATNDRLAT